MSQDTNTLDKTIRHQQPLAALTTTHDSQSYQPESFSETQGIDINKAHLYSRVDNDDLIDHFVHLPCAEQVQLVLTTLQ